MQLDVDMSPTANIMNYCPVNFRLVILSQTDRQRESDAYEPTMHGAQVGSKIVFDSKKGNLLNMEKILFKQLIQVGSIMQNRSKIAYMAFCGHNISQHPFVV